MSTGQELAVFTDRQLFNALCGNAAVVAPDGKIKSVNSSWIKFGEDNGLLLADNGINSNYFAICEAAGGHDREFALHAAQSIQEIATGSRITVPLQYPCHSPTEQRWFLLRATSIENHGHRSVLVLHENITFLVANQDRLSSVEAELAGAAMFISHDIRAPLHTVQNCIDLIRADAGDTISESTAEYLEMASETVHRLSRFATDVLNFAVIGHQHEIPMVRLDINEAVRDAIKSIATLIEERRATVMVETLGCAFGNPVYLVQLFQNLIGNAIHHSGTDVMIRVGMLEKDTGIMYFVQDSGPGIAAEDQEIIFQPFRRPHSIGKAGAGLGLAICHHIVACHGGRLSVESESGRGSTFYFSLPMAYSSIAN